MAREPRQNEAVSLAEVDGAEAIAAATFAPLPPIATDPVVAPAVSTPIADVAAPEQSPPTRPRPMTPEGFELDEWGLPRVGPVRVALLEKAGRIDPNIDPTDWERVDAPAGTQE